MQPKPVPKLIDPYKLSKNSTSIVGVLRLNLLPRLNGMILGMGDFFTVHLNFFANNAIDSDLIICALNGSISGELQLACERCGKAVNYEIKNDFNVKVLKTGLESRLPESKLIEDYILVQDFKVNLHEFLEEEIILSLPILPKHENLQLCGIKAEDFVSNVSSVNTNHSSQNPFHVLESMKKDK